MENKTDILDNIAGLSCDISITPGDHTLYMERGKLYHRLGEYHKAMNDFIRADELSGGNEEARSYISILREIFEFRNLDMYNP